MSLDAATQKVSGLVHSLSQDLSVVKERVPKTPEDNLSTDESAAIYLYTMGPKPANQSLYERLNNSLCAKNNYSFIRLYIPYLKLLITALSKLEPMGQVIYRGIKADLSEKYPVGKTFVWSKFR